MSKKPYAELLLDPRWQREHLAVLEYADFKCQLCGDGKITLHVHHSYYTKGKKPWEYPRGSMIVLCDKCHFWFHEKKKQERYERMYRHATPPPQPVAAEPPAYEDLTPVVDTSTPWGRVIVAVSKSRPLQALWLEHGTLASITEDGVATVSFPFEHEIGTEVFTRPTGKGALEEALSAEFGRPIKLKAVTEVAQ